MTVMFENLEPHLGHKALWDVQDLLNSFRNNKMSFDTLVVKYIELPVKTIRGSVDDQEAIHNKKKCSLWAQQAEQYEKGDTEDFSKDMNATVRNLFGVHIFPNCVFPSEPKDVFLKPNLVILDEEDKKTAGQTTTIAMMLLDKLGLQCSYSLEQKIKWWNTYGGLVYKHFSAFRSTRVCTMQCNFLSFYEKEKQLNPSSSVNEAGVDVTIDTGFNNLMLLCDDKNLFADDLLDLNVEKDAYRAFLDICVVALFKKNCFKRLMSSKLLSEVVTVTEEAFALLSFENCLARWTYIAENGKGGTVPPLKYQENPSQRKDNKINGGRWREEGLARMNELLQKVSDVRKDRGEFERGLKEMYRNGVTSDELTSGWLLTASARKKKARSGVFVKNCLNFAAV